MNIKRAEAFRKMKKLRRIARRLYGDPEKEVEYRKIREGFEFWT